MNPKSLEPQVKAQYFGKKKRVCICVSSPQTPWMQIFAARPEYPPSRLSCYCSTDHRSKENNVKQTKRLEKCKRFCWEKCNLFFFDALMLSRPRREYPYDALSNIRKSIQNNSNRNKILFSALSCWRKNNLACALIIESVFCPKI